jgi:hypothetical protein
LTILVGQDGILRADCQFGPGELRSLTVKRIATFC